MAKDIFILHSCDEWKSYDGMRVVCASTSIEKIKEAIIAEIKDKNMDYSDSEWSRSKMLNEFKNDWEFGLRNEIFDNLIYGFCDCVEDGERQ